MLETGQPLHFYDADKVQGEIVVRRAAAGEKLVTLDGVERTLHPEDIVIADDSGVIGLAGVMGGASTEVTDSTTRILVEAARFDEVSVARTARRHKLISESSSVLSVAWIRRFRLRLLSVRLSCWLSWLALRLSRA